jgi:hypothetical protein
LRGILAIFAVKSLLIGRFHSDPIEKENSCG